MSRQATKEEIERRAADERIVTEVSFRLGQLNDALTLAADAGITADIGTIDLTNFGDEGNRLRVSIRLERIQSTVLLDSQG